MAKTKRQKAAPQTREVIQRVGTIAIPARDARGMGADRAMRVPAFRRGSNLITGTVAQLPLVEWKGDSIGDINPLLHQPEVDFPYFTTMQRTVEDLLHYAVAYWHVLMTDSDGFPTKVRLLPATEVNRSELTPNWVTYKGETLRVSDPTGPGTKVGHVIVFPGYRHGVLHDGIDVIELALALEDAALNYAKSPLPQLALKNDGADLTGPEIKQLLTDWETARAERSTAYLNSVMSTEQFGWSSAELQLVEARGVMAVQIARLLNLDPMWVGAVQSGSSITYSNRVDMRKDFIDFTLSDYINPIEQRLSMRDCTPTQYQTYVRFNTTEYLRASLAERVAFVAALHPLDVITTDEARLFLSDNPFPRSFPP